MFSHGEEKEHCDAPEALPVAHGDASLSPSPSVGPGSESAGGTTDSIAGSGSPGRRPGMIQAAHVGNPKIGKFCRACMDGDYPTGDVTTETLAEIESERLKAHRAIEEG